MQILNFEIINPDDSRKKERQRERAKERILSVTIISTPRIFRSNVRTDALWCNLCGDYESQIHISKRVQTAFGETVKRERSFLLLRS